MPINPNKLPTIVLGVTEDELSYMLLSVRFMNYQLQGDNAHALKCDQRENLEEYLKVRKQSRANTNSV